MGLRVHQVILIMLSVLVFIGIHAFLSLFDKKKGFKQIVFGGR